MGFPQAQPAGSVYVAIKNDEKLAVWYPDSGACTHITGNQSILNNPQVYSGYTIISAANGQRMEIIHTGGLCVQNGNRKFMLNDIHLIPSATKHLLSVYQFCLDNRLFLEFDWQMVRVRDVDTKEVLLQGL